MISDEIRQKLQNIVRGEFHQGQSDACTAICDLLCKSFGSGPTVKNQFEGRAVIKERQVGFLKAYAQRTDIWMDSLPQGSLYLTEGGESKVYLSSNGKLVYKVNDAGYYATWAEYFSSLLLHNLLFSNSAYQLLGFTERDDRFCAVVQQPFVEGEQASLEHIEEFLAFNGFVKVRRQDYYNNEFRLVLEDMHDENVIAKDNVLFFIDTVFYIT